MNKELKQLIASDRKANIKNQSKKHFFLIWITRDMEWIRWCYIKRLRKVSYYYNAIKKSKNPFLKLLLFFNIVRKNKLGLQLGFEIGPGKIGKGLCIFHNGPIVINGKSIIGNNCIMHGDNCIGNNGSDDACPVIGDNVDIGVGAKIIGNVFIANNCKIGAGAIVVKSCYEEGAVLVGCPAKPVTNK